jgi:hypothetical protein
MGSVNVLDQLSEHADAVLRLEREANEHRAAIRKLLPRARAQGHGPAELERVIRQVYVRETISRWTKARVTSHSKRAAAA